MENKLVGNQIMKKEQLEWRWCLVGNIVDKRIYGEKHEIRYGTKNFSPGTKVYIAPNQWGDGGEQLVVLANPRNKQGYIECVIKSDYIYNFRLKKIYSPLLLKRMNESVYEWWGNDDEWRKCIIAIAEDRNKDFKLKSKNIINTIEDLLSNIDKLHTTEISKERIKNNLKLDNDEVVEYCKKKILDKKCIISRVGKNWYCEIDNIRITINACSFTIITAHLIE
jgi:hypothetical protein